MVVACALWSCAWQGTETIVPKIKGSDMVVSQRKRTVAAVQAPDVLGDAMDRLSPQLRRAARFLKRHPDLVAMHSLRDLAKRAEVGPATFVRLAQALRFSGYPELRREILRRILPGALSYAGKGGKAAKP